VGSNARAGVRLHGSDLVQKARAAVATADAYRDLRAKGISASGLRPAKSAAAATADAFRGFRAKGIRARGFLILRKEKGRGLPHPFRRSCSNLGYAQVAFAL